MPSRLVQSLRWTPLFFIGAITLGFLLGGIRGPTMYEGMRIIRLGFIGAAAIATVAAVATVVHWRQLSMFSRMAALSPFALVFAFACYVVADDAA